MDLEQQYKLALDTAKKSECIRRKYGVVMTYEGFYTNSSPVLGYNKRIGRCCDGELCSRDRYRTRNGERVELGAEIHAEQMALVDASSLARNTRFLIAGLDAKGSELIGKIAYPCHVCAIMIAYYGVNSVWLKTHKTKIEPVSIWEIIEYRESEWEHTYDV